MGKYKDNESEVLDIAKSIREAKYLVHEYLVAFGSGWVIWVKK